MNIINRWYVHTPERVKTIIAYTLIISVFIGLGMVW